MRQPVVFISDRINVIGLSNYLKLLELLHGLGIRAVSIDQHSGGGFWEEKYILPVKRALAYCQELGMDVYITAHDGSKCDYGSPAGLLVKANATPYKPRLKETVIDGHRVQFQAILANERVYWFNYVANKRCSIHLFDATDERWQLVKWDGAKAGEVGTIEFRSAKGVGLHNLIFVAENDGTQLEVDITGHGAIGDPATIQPRTFQTASGLWWYRGARGISGNAFCRTPNFYDRPTRLQAYKNTFGKIAKTYGEFIGDPIVGTRIEWDEFTAVGDMFRGEDMIRAMKECGMLSQTFFGPAIIDARPQDFYYIAQKDDKDYYHPSRNNTMLTWAGMMLSPEVHIGHEDGLIPCAWQEQTTPELCIETFRRSNAGAMAGVNVEYSDPQHFWDAGFRTAGIYYYPQDGKTWLDIPQDKLTKIIEVFRAI